ncbi:MAG: dihydroorotate dehydrogenase [Eubacteriales bacterium]|nr:dihydroorotate dehydrogenase [Eubacteriales bacterium]
MEKDNKNLIENGSASQAGGLDLSVELAGVKLDNPVIPASGTFGYGQEFAKLYDLNILGSISFKGTTKDPRYGNPLPRIAECEGGILNAVGLQNPGVDHVIEHELPELRKIFHKPLVANISGFSIDDYTYACEKIDKEDQIGIIEVNISCPNVHGGGMAFGTDPASAAAVTKAVKSVTSKPVFIKLTPNVTDIVSIAKACEDAGADGLSLINTLLGMRIDTRARRPLLANKTGGFSGPAVFPVAVRMVYQVASACRVPIIGMGGIATADDVIEMMMAGASAVEVGTANVVEPYACKNIVEDLPRAMERLGITKLRDITGAALDM